MKTNYVIPASILTLALGCAAGGWAADYGSPSGSPSSQATSPAGQAAAITGTVQKVDVDNSSVQIKDTSGNVQMIKVDVSAQISRQGNTIQLAELKKGDVVTIKNTSSPM